jgi:predicted nucleic acid-binding protein
LKLIFDASSIINLIKANALGIVLQLHSHTFYVGPQAEGECGANEPELNAAFAAGSVARADDGDLPANSFADLLNLYDLGDGETECLAFADADAEFVICCDDGAARRVASGRCGEARVIGSLHLLRECVRQGIITAEAAQLTYELMKNRGGFLPDLAHDYFTT